jgi:hypothetical protein
MSVWHVYPVLIHGVVQCSKTDHSKWILFHVLKYLSVYDKGNVAASEQSGSEGTAHCKWAVADGETPDVGQGREAHYWYCSRGLSPQSICFVVVNFAYHVVGFSKSNAMAQNKYHNNFLPIPGVTLSVLHCSPEYPHQS